MSKMYALGFEMKIYLIEYCRWILVKPGKYVGILGWKKHWMSLLLKCQREKKGLRYIPFQGIVGWTSITATKHSSINKSQGVDAALSLPKVKYWVNGFILIGSSSKMKLESAKNQKWTPNPRQRVQWNINNKHCCTKFATKRITSWINGYLMEFLRSPESRISKEPFVP